MPEIFNVKVAGIAAFCQEKIQVTQKAVDSVWRCASSYCTFDVPDGDDEEEWAHFLHSLP